LDVLNKATVVRMVVVWKVPAGVRRRRREEELQTGCQQGTMGPRFGAVAASCSC
jgi:hypothetical protein